MKNKYSIEVVVKNNFSEAWPLIQECLIGYGLPLNKTNKHKKFFLSIANKPDDGIIHLCKINAEVVGFSTVYFTFSTYYASRVIFLNDLYVKKEFRGKGAGRELIENVFKVAKNNDVGVVQWLVSPKNKVANKFYCSIDTVKSEWVRHSWVI